MDDLKRIEKILRENASEKKEMKPGLKFNLRTTGPWAELFKAGLR